MRIDSGEISVSIIIPIYNAEKYLDECIESVLGQSFIKKEIICVDDGSIDKSLSILENYQNKYSYIRVFRQNHCGAAKARNYGIKKAKGRFIAFMDADDLYPEKDVLCTLYNLASNNNAYICGGNTILFKKDWLNGEKYEPSDNQNFNTEGIIQFCKYGCAFGYTRFLYDRKFLMDNELFFPDYECWEDPVFMARAFSCARSIYAVDKIVYCYRRNIHKKEHRIKDVIDLLNSTADILCIAKKSGNITLEKNTIDVLMRSYSKVCQIYNTNRKIVSLTITAIKRNIFGELDKEYLDKLERLDLGKIEEENNIYDNCLHELKEKAICCEKCVIYGAGIYGKRLLDIFFSMGIKPEGFAVTKIENNNTEISGFPVKSIEEWKNNCFFFIAVNSEDSKSDISKELDNRGMRGFVVSNRLLDRETLE
ncbi:glycosyltransferase family 2 protein [Oribacterium sp. NK2B42]|uniref:glycosyltransferase family 2 protein n=1 Tax=Oribacterium sp. NK2B42 TaxID=689781 RepID=UPI0004272E59|nr:glycosyltransferase family 2 protein [Oribacterium sp. NK2B42]